MAQLHNGKTEYELKEQMCEIGRRIYNRGFAAANDGNITVRLNEREYLCTPTMVSKGYMKPEDICRVDAKGVQLAGKRKRTSEVMLHLSVYNQRPDINGVVHCHPPHATAFAVAHEPIPKCVLPEVEVFLGEVPIAVYETPGGSILFAAHRQVESITMDREVMHLRDSLIPKYAALVYNGFWFSPERDALQALVTESQKHVTGEVRLKLYKGNIMAAGRRSAFSLYDEAIATMEKDPTQSYNQNDATGFISLNALRLKASARRASAAL
jgi:ribulose-5-phosphate 4-epimerase/fuculose-1-phosphate aldolase